MGMCHSSNVLARKVASLEEQCKTDHAIWTSRLELLTSNIQEQHQTDQSTFAQRIGTAEDNLHQTADALLNGVEQWRSEATKDVDDKLSALNVSLNKSQVRATLLSETLDQLRQDADTTVVQLNKYRDAHEAHNRFLESCTSVDELARRVTLTVGESVFNTNIATLLRSRSMLAHLVKYRKRDHPLPRTQLPPTTSPHSGEKRRIPSHADDRATDEKQKRSRLTASAAAAATTTRTTREILSLDDATEDAKEMEMEEEEEGEDPSSTTTTTEQQQPLVFFIDRPAEVFGTLINFLRTGNCAYFEQLLVQHYPVEAVHSIGSDRKGLEVIMHRTATSEWISLWTEILFYQIEALIEAKEARERAFVAECKAQCVRQTQEAAVAAAPRHSRRAPMRWRGRGQ